MKLPGLRLLNLNQEPSEDGTTTREARSANGPEYVDPGFAAGGIQAAFMQLEDEESAALAQVIYTTCKMQEISSQGILASAQTPNGATALARVITGLNNVKGRLSGNELRISTCSPLAFGQWHFNPMNGTCTEEIPIHFVLTSPTTSHSDMSTQRTDAYMNPSTRIITGVSTAADCDDADEIPVDFEPPIVVNGPTAHVSTYTGTTYHLYPAFSRSIVGHRIIIPEFYGVSMAVSNMRPTMQDNEEFVGNMKKMAEDINSLIGEEPGANLDVKKILNKIGPLAIINALFPTFDDNWYIRLWLLLCSTYVTLQVASRFFMPLGLLNQVNQWVGFGRLAEQAYNGWVKAKDLKALPEQRVISDPLLP